MITKAMVMSAGVGSRLEPLTLTTPKPLIKISNVPVMDILLCNLKKYGISDVIANTYYLAEQIIERYSNGITVSITNGKVTSLYSLVPASRRNEETL